MCNGIGCNPEPVLVVARLRIGCNPEPVLVVARLRIGCNQNVYWAYPKHVFAVVSDMNNTPREDLGGLTPHEATFGLPGNGNQRRGKQRESSVEAATTCPPPDNRGPPPDNRGNIQRDQAEARSAAESALPRYRELQLLQENQEPSVLYKNLMSKEYHIMIPDTMTRKWVKPFRIEVLDAYVPGRLPPNHAALITGFAHKKGAEPVRFELANLTRKLIKSGSPSGTMLPDNMEQACPTFHTILSHAKTRKPVLANAKTRSGTCHNTFCHMSRTCSGICQNALWHVPEQVLAFWHVTEWC